MEKIRKGSWGYLIMAVTSGAGWVNNLPYAG